MTTHRGSTVRSMSERSIPASSTQIRMQFSHRYALIAGSQACGANLENCERDSSYVTSCNAPCSQRNLMFLIGSMSETKHRLACFDVQTPKPKAPNPACTRCQRTTARDL